MVRHTRPQSTPRREKYSSTAASRLESTHDHAFDRVPPPEACPLRILMGALLFHEVVRNHVQDHHMEIFDPSGMGMGDPDLELRQGPQVAALPARESDGPAADGIAEIGRAHG